MLAFAGYIKLYAFQKIVFNKVIEHFLTDTKALIDLAPGLGKTIISAFLAKHYIGLGHKVLFLCHRNEVLEQSMSKYRLILGMGAKLGLFHGNEKTYDDVNVLFASYRTFKEHKHLFFEDEFALIICDEAHSGKAITYEEVISYFKPKKILGMTATRRRLDGKDIGEIFGKVVAHISLEEAIVKGYLPPIEYELRTDGITEEKLRAIAEEALGKGNTATLKHLNKVLFVQKRDEEIAGIITEKNMKAIVFCRSVKYADRMQKLIPNSAVYHSKISKAERDRILREFKAGNIRILISVEMLIEGVDVPDTEMVVFLRGTSSMRIFVQILGRVVRRIEGKKKALVLDFVGSYQRIEMLKSFEENIKTKAKDSGYALVVSGKGFQFKFSREARDLLDIITLLRKKSYISDLPELAKEYMPPPKNDLTANQVIAGTGTKLWWKCSRPECSHEWQATGSHRVNGRCCPACANKLATEKNNLAVTHPELAKEYMPPPKNELSADQVTAGTNKKLWWKCTRPDCGHEWQAKGSTRAKGGGCPACSNKVVTEKNNLTVTHPELAKEYMPPPKNELPANQIIAGTGRKLWWKCSKPSCLYEWQAACYNRIRGIGCPACANQVATQKNSLTVTHPELAKEYMPPPKNELPADQVIAGTSKKLWWKCSRPDCGHEWQAIGHSRAKGSGCPICARRKKKGESKNN